VLRAGVARRHPRAFGPGGRDAGSIGVHGVITKTGCTQAASPVEWRPHCSGSWQPASRRISDRLDPSRASPEGTEDDRGAGWGQSRPDWVSSWSVPTPCGNSLSGSIRRERHLEAGQILERDLGAARTRDGTREGFIIPIGGAEEKMGDTRILSNFVQLCGGDEAAIAIIPTASELEDSGLRYEESFQRIGVKCARAVPFNSREDCEREDWLEVLEEADGIFMADGNQLRLSTIVGGTPVARAVRDASARGVHVAGTSAGAGFMSEHMIAFGGEGLLPCAGVQLRWGSKNH
jgi:hypothetical protein